MIYDYRVYTFKPGKVPEYMAAVEELSIGIRAKYGIKLAGWYYSDIGDLNQVVHNWATGTTPTSKRPRPRSPKTPTGPASTYPESPAS